ncbi:MAG TPA: menaquinone biosynthesis protein [Pyrinomonadaceae bacterium]|nr:menaquinone biosynthesis protein [Pyrinomonadaceae bacterium]
MKPKIAASSYLNSAPLIWSFTKGSMAEDVDLTSPVPALCADLLASGQADAALVPVIEFQRMKDLLIVPDVCVGSKGKVLSVVLVSKREDLEGIHSAALDESSRTSSTLIKVIFREFIGSEPEWMSARPDLHSMLEANDAALIIGDPGMTFERQGLFVLDLASLWHRYTGLGFVFAMWMVRKDKVHCIRNIDFARARDEGLEHIEEIVSDYQERIPLGKAALLEYLTANITFFMDQSMRRGLNEFFRLAHKHGLISSVKQTTFL